MDEFDDLEVTTFLPIVMTTTVAEMISAAEFHCCSFKACGSCSLVRIATGYGLDGPGIESRWEARFSAPVQTVPGAHPDSFTMGTGSFLGVKNGRAVTLTPHPLIVLWSSISRPIPLLPYGPYGLYRASVPVQGCTLPYLPLKAMYNQVSHLKILCFC
jgi:hypothetical protein